MRSRREDPELEPAHWIDESQDTNYKRLTEHIKVLEDPRMLGKTGHNLLDVIFISVCAYICGANSWDGVYEFAKTRHLCLTNYFCLVFGLFFRVSFWCLFVFLFVFA